MTTKNNKIKIAQCVECSMSFKQKTANHLCCSGNCSYKRSNKRKNGIYNYKNRSKIKIDPSKTIYNKFCKFCSTKFETNRSGKVFCCKQCGDKHKRIIRPEIYRKFAERHLVGKVKLICKICKSEFKGYIKRDKYCTPECAKEANYKLKKIPGEQ